MYHLALPRCSYAFRRTALASFTKELRLCAFEEHGLDTGDCGGAVQASNANRRLKMWESVLVQVRAVVPMLSVQLQCIEPEHAWYAKYNNLDPFMDLLLWTPSMRKAAISLEQYMGMRVKELSEISLVFAMGKYLIQEEPTLWIPTLEI